MAAEATIRPAPLVLSIAIPALLAVSLAAYFVLPHRGAISQAPVASPPSEPPEIALGEPPARSGRPALPLKIEIPGAHAAGPVDPIRAIGGQLEIPPTGRAGWFKGGPRPGEPGRAVVVSHVDSLEGPALFASLNTLERGTRIRVQDRRGAVHRFRLTDRRQLEKGRFRPSLVYGPSRRPTLVLVTCGGPFTPGEGYRDNVILYAQAA